MSAARTTVSIIATAALAVITTRVMHRCPEGAVILEPLPTGDHLAR